MDTRTITVAQAAKYLSTSESAIRHKVNRNTIPHEKDEETGRVFILIDKLEDEVLSGDNLGRTTGDPSDNERLIAMLTKQLELSQEALAQEREANREQRRLLAAALERIPALDAPQNASPEPSESPETATDEAPSDRGQAEAVEPVERPPFWRRFFLGE